MSLLFLSRNLTYSLFLFDLPIHYIYFFLTHSSAPPPPISSFPLTHFLPRYSPYIYRRRKSVYKLNALFRYTYISITNLFPHFLPHILTAKVHFYSLHLNAAYMVSALPCLLDLFIKRDNDHANLNF